MSDQAEPAASGQDEKPAKFGTDGGVVVPQNEAPEGPPQFGTGGGVDVPRARPPIDFEERDQDQA